MRAYLLPLWALGVILSFALPAVPAWPAVAALWLLLLAAAWRCKPFMLLCALLAGMAYGVWRTERDLAAQWPLQAAGGVWTPRPPQHLQSYWRNVNTPEDLADTFANSAHHLEG